MTYTKEQEQKEKLLAWEMLEVYAVHLAYACTDTEKEERAFWVRVLNEKDRLQEEARALIAKHEEEKIYGEE